MDERKKVLIYYSYYLLIHTNSPFRTELGGTECILTKTVLITNETLKKTDIKIGQSSIEQVLDKTQKQI